MPIPINPVGDNTNQNRSAEKTLIDYSWLFSNIPEINEKASKKIVTASDKDAEMLMELWLHSEKKDESTFKVNKETKLSSQDIIRLKSHGLICGGSEDLKLTGRGKAVITTMVLGESNNFLKNQKSKSYTEILASMSKKGKKGYRIPVIANNGHLLQNGSK